MQSKVKVLVFSTSKYYGMDAATSLHKMCTKHNGNNVLVEIDLFIYSFTHAFRDSSLCFFNTGTLMGVRSITDKVASSGGNYDDLAAASTSPGYKTLLDYTVILMDFFVVAWYPHTYSKIGDHFCNASDHGVALVLTGFSNVISDDERDDERQHKSDIFSRGLFGKFEALYHKFPSATDYSYDKKELHLVPLLKNHQIFNQVSYYSGGSHSGHCIMRLVNNSAPELRVLANWSDSSTMIAQWFNPVNGEAVILGYNGVLASKKHSPNLWDEKISDGHQLFYNMVTYAASSTISRRGTALKLKLFKYQHTRTLTDVTIELVANS